MVRANRGSRAGGGNGQTSRSANPPAKSNHLASLENQLRQRLGTKVEIRAKTKDSGVITIHFSSNDDFERVMEVLVGRAM